MLKVAAQGSGRAVALAVAAMLLLGVAAIRWLTDRIVLGVVIAAFDGTRAREGIEYFRNLAGLLAVGAAFAAVGLGPLLLLLIGLTLVVIAVAGGACGLLRNSPRY